MESDASRRLIIDLKTGRRFFLEPVIDKVKLKGTSGAGYGLKYQGVIIFENDIEVGRVLVKESPHKAIDKILKKSPVIQCRIPV